MSSDDQSMEKVDFSSLILGFSSAALHYMGYSDPSQKGASKPNWVLAKQNMAIVALLQEKTRGNLEEKEERLLKDVLEDLQLRLEEAP